MEKWKDIPEYEGLYQASNLGRVRTHPCKVTYTEKHGARHWKSRIMKGRGKSDSGYRVGLWKNGKCKDYLIARLVAFTWVEGYEEGFTVNHKNGNRFDNRVDNLEWLSLKDNIRHGFETGLYHCRKEVILKHTTTNKTYKFKSMKDASMFLGYNQGYLSCRIRRYGNKSIKGYEIKITN